MTFAVFATASWTANAAQPIDVAHAKALCRIDGHLIVATDQNSVESIDAASGKIERRWTTEKPVGLLTNLDGRVGWVEENTRTISIADLDCDKVLQIEIPGRIVHGALNYIGSWDGQVVAQGESDFAIVDPVTHLCQRPEDVLPADIAKIAKQGVVKANWSHGEGIFLSIRRYGQKVHPAPGEFPELAIMTAWSGRKNESMRLLGAYTYPMVGFHDAPGPDVVIPMGMRTIQQHFGSAVTGNIKIGPEGIVALGRNESIAVPFTQDNWNPNRLKTPFPPSYPKNADFAQESAWWSDGNRVFRSDLADGSAEAFVPKDGQPITAISCDDRGAWAATSTDIRRIELDGDDSDWTCVGASAEEAPQTHEQAVLLREIHKTDFYYPVSGSKLNSLLSAAGSHVGQRVPEAEIGDVIQDTDLNGIYVGGGQMLVTEAGRLRFRQFEPSKDTTILRVLPRSALTAEDLAPVRPPVTAPVTPVPPRMTQPERYRTEPFQPSVPASGKFDDIFPVGVNRPKPSLGTDLFAYCVPGSTTDQPFTATHERLFQEARSWIGTPYRWGGTSRSGVDCSGFVQAVFRSVGISLPRCSQDMGRVKFGKVVRGALHFGDVLVFQYPHHVAIYVGNGRTIEAVSGGVGWSTIYRRSQAIVRRFLE